MMQDTGYRMKDDSIIDSWICPSGLAPCALRLKPYNIRYPFLFSLLLLLMIAACAGDQAAIIKKQKKVEALQQLGIAHAAEGNLRKGLAKLLEAVKLDPDNAELNHQIAVVLRVLGEYKLSLKYFNRALAIKPKDPETRNNLGTLYLEMGEWDKAIACFKEAVSDILYNSPQFAYN
ncbi:MAG: tetratricopeptide repeat protein, partial [Deltaproteobacteria bacterium]|nr:tetratricopeptide repeat protein [Candidatus Desulfacyla euxinica]